MNGYDLITAERQRQIEIENWSHTHDDQQGVSTLERAAFCYRDAHDVTPLPDSWPWSAEWWKPKDRQRNLERAGALYLAAAEAADRAGQSTDKQRLLGYVEACALMLNSLLDATNNKVLGS
ncbi:hypothetical protein [Vibrio sp. Hal054]|uniref:hypothetical protein n=1 Tax=Vibrio sp. Hal054 TaxID=3035158 RepID=UPI00301DC460